jgi:competence protein ComFB
MAIRETYDFQFLKNEAERIVLDELERQLDACQGKLCRCNDCIVDMAALSLNMVKPLYRYSILGELYTAQATDDAAYAESVRLAVENAIDRVRKNPSHE